MKNTLLRKITFPFVLCVLAGVSGALAQTPQLTASNRQVRTILTRVQMNAAALKRDIDQSRLYGSTTNADERVSDQLTALTNSVNSLRSSTYSRNTDVSGDVNDILDRTGRINRILSRNGTNSRISTRWVSIRTDVNTLAGYYGMSWNWNESNNTGSTGWNGGSQVPQFPATDRRVRTILDQLASRTTMFQRDVQRARYPWDADTTDERIADQVLAFANAVNSLRTSVYSRTDSSDELSGVLSRASRISMLLDRNRNGVNSNVTSEWNLIRTDVNTLAGYYNTAWNWNEPYNNGNGYPTTGNNGYPTGSSIARLTGTYRLNAGLSDNVSTVIDRSIGSNGADQRDDARRGLERRLQSPEMIAIEKNGRTISMASSNRPQVSFEADGVARTETNSRGRVITTTVTSTNNDLNINYVGDQTDDFTVSFTADRNGRLRVTREIYLENRGEKVTVSSVYDRVSDVAKLSDVYTAPIGGSVNGGNTGSNGDFYIANGVSLTATLRNPVSTRASQIGDRFTMDVNSPNQYRGAVIEGRVEQAASSGRINGRASVSLVFDTITVNGRRYSFSGIIESVTAANGDSVTVNNEGMIRDSNQGTTTAARAGIGAVLGAIIGAIAGGGQGAAIGAGVGAGVGAGSVLVTGRDAIDLAAGSTFRITATAPQNAGYGRN